MAEQRDECGTEEQEIAAWELIKTIARFSNSHEQTGAMDQDQDNVDTLDVLIAKAREIVNG